MHNFNKKTVGMIFGLQFLYSARTPEVQQQFQTFNKALTSVFSNELALLTCDFDF